ncbi:MAG TPA: L-histidine N(alpha)-methyltransferase, partial [Ramlibacter sp.]|nr:L-histidine N(alpha)-methyltransferase [Ramlibacter sp.]
MLTRTHIKLLDAGDSQPAEDGALDSAFAHDMLRALESRPRSVSPKYFYDAQGSQLFDRICELPEYYPT